MSLGPGAQLIVHDIRQAHRAFSIAAMVKSPVTLVSPANSPAVLGPKVFNTFVDQASTYVENRTEFAAILNCGSEPGQALQAMDDGSPWVHLETPGEAADKIRDIATQKGVHFTAGPIDALDLSDPEITDVQIMDWLENGATA